VAAPGGGFGVGGLRLGGLGCGSAGPFLGRFLALLGLAGFLLRGEDLVGRRAVAGLLGFPLRRVAIGFGLLGPRLLALGPLAFEFGLSLRP
jgi:hypothetical protein